MYIYIYSQSLHMVFIGALIIVFLYAALNTYLPENMVRRSLNLIIFTFSLYIILNKTIYDRDANVIEIELRPFYSFVLAKTVPEYYRSLFMNAVLFVPFGVTMPYALSKGYKRNNILITIISACVLSITIEFAQYYFSIGRCETDDVIFNTFGAAVGTLSYLLYGYFIKKGDSMNTKLNTTQIKLCKLCANSLFDEEITESIENYDEILSESAIQTVLPIAYSALKNNGLKNNYADKHFSSIVAQNIRVDYDHTEIHKLLSKNNIKYIILKGVASASYYKEPLLRTMGDVDILINSVDVGQVDKLMQAIGYTTADDINSNEKHIEYKRIKGKTVSVCEVHTRINGIPSDKTDLFNKHFADVFESSKLLKTSNSECIVPSNFHHGVILLLHTASHLTSEGVGLRHLCDWAVFVNGFSNDEFVTVFEKPLKELGLWRFAELLTSCCIKYLGCDKKEWVGQAEYTLLEDIVTDILNGGNFGYKNVDRYAQIKYISNRETNKPSKKGVISQVFASINAKAKTEYAFVKKYKILLPLGWIAVLYDYFLLVLTRKRKLDNINTINSAKHRQSIYKEFKLFETDN